MPANIKLLPLSSRPGWLLEEQSACIWLMFLRTWLISRGLNCTGGEGEGGKSQDNYSYRFAKIYRYFKRHDVSWFTMIVEIIIVFTSIITCSVIIPWVVEIDWDMSRDPICFAWFTFWKEHVKGLVDIIICIMHVSSWCRPRRPYIRVAS